MPFAVTDVVQLAVLAGMYYSVFLFFRGTRGAHVLIGLALVFAFFLGITQVLELDVLNWILRQFTVFVGLALLVIFQPEIRRALAELGRQPAFAVTAERRSVVDNLVQAVHLLAEHRIGALIAVEREIATGNAVEGGTRLDAALAPELLASLFFPHTPLHDGGVIVRGDRIAAAGCVFPLSQNVDLQKTLGMRHRAAVGLSEETDAVVVIVSEETGGVSVAYRGRLSQGLDEERLRRFLVSLLLRDRKTGSVWRRAIRQLDLTPQGIAKSEGRAGAEEGQP